MRESFDWGFWFVWLMSTALGWVLGSFLLPNLALVTTGLALGCLQWFTINRRFKEAWRWIVVSTLGWALGAALILILIPAQNSANMVPQSGFLAGVLTGLMLGGAQWLVLRREVHWAGWWIPVNIIAWTTGFAFLPGLLSTGVSAGVITATAMALLVLNPAKQASPGE